MRRETAPEVSYYFRLSKSPEVDERLAAALDPKPLPPPHPEKEILNRNIADALVAANPRLTTFEHTAENPSAHGRISAEKARRLRRSIDLNGPNGGNGIQICLFENSAILTVPLWHNREIAARAFDELLIYLRIIAGAAEYSVFDSQVGKVIDLGAGLGESLACYQGGVKLLPNS